MVLLTLTDRIMEAIQTAMSCADLDQITKAKLSAHIRPETPEKCISLDLLKVVSKFLVARDEKMGKDMGLSKYWLHELMMDSTPYSEPQKPRRTLDIVARLEEVIKQHENAQQLANRGPRLGPADFKAEFRRPRGAVPARFRHYAMDLSVSS